MSAILGKEIACFYDKYGPVRVYDDGNKRHLSFGNDDEQSCISKAEPGLLQYDYNRSMMLVMLLCEPRNALLLGLGGGSLCNCLIKHYPQMSLTVVELRELVIDVAKHYFDLPSAKQLEVINTDALEYVSELNDNQHDLIFSDLYIAEGLEARQLTQRFIRNAKRVLTDEGFLVMNSLYEYRTEQVMRTLLFEHFETIYERVTDDGNWVIIACNGQAKIHRKKLMEKAKVLSKKLGFSVACQLKYLN